MNSNLLTCLSVVEGTVLICHVSDENSWLITRRSIRASVIVDSKKLFIQVIIFLLKRETNFSSGAKSAYTVIALTL